MNPCPWPRVGHSRRIIRALLAFALLWGGGAAAQVPVQTPVQTPVQKPVQMSEQMPLQPIPASGGVPAALEPTTLQVDSTPSGAVVTLRGPYEWVGQTPWRLDREITGLYQVEAVYPGYSTWFGEVVLGPGGTQHIQITLSRKTRFKAFARSLILPGWGQFYAKEPGKGSIIVGGLALSLAGVIWSDIAYQRRLDSFIEAKRAYESARQMGSEWDRLYREVERTSHRADHSYDARRLCLTATAGIYALAALDALFLFPNRTGDALTAIEPRGTSAQSTDDRLSWNAFAGAESVRLGLTVRWD